MSNQVLHLKVLTDTDCWMPPRVRPQEARRIVPEQADKCLCDNAGPDWAQMFAFGKDLSLFQDVVPERRINPNPVSGFAPRAVATLWPDGRRSARPRKRLRNGKEFDGAN
jgi:hypothetical protein